MRFSETLRRRLSARGRLALDGIERAMGGFGPDDRRVVMDELGEGAELTPEELVHFRSLIGDKKARDGSPDIMNAMARTAPSTARDQGNDLDEIVEALRDGNSRVWDFYRSRLSPEDFSELRRRVLAEPGMDRPTRDNPPDFPGEPLPGGGMVPLGSDMLPPSLARALAAPARVLPNECAPPRPSRAARVRSIAGDDGDYATRFPAAATTRILTMPKLARQPMSLQREPGRQRLADAIERHRGASAELNRIRAAQQRHFEEVRMPAQQALDDAVRAFDELKATETRALAAAFLGETAATTLSDARNALAEAKAAADHVEKVRDGLDAREREAVAELDTAELFLRDAQTAAVKADPAMPALVSRYEAMKRELAALTLLMAETHLYHPDRYEFDALRHYSDLPTDGTRGVACCHRAHARGCRCATAIAMISILAASSVHREREPAGDARDQEQHRPRRDAD